MARYFVSKLCCALDLPCAVHRLDDDGRVYWRNHDTPTIWFPAGPEDRYRTAADLEAGHLVEITPPE